MSNKQNKRVIERVRRLQCELNGTVDGIQRYYLAKQINQLVQMIRLPHHGCEKNAKQS